MTGDDAVVEALRAGDIVALSRSIDPVSGAYGSSRVNAAEAATKRCRWSTPRTSPT